MEKQQPGMEWYYRLKSDTKAAHFKNSINIFPQLSECMSVYNLTQKKDNLHVTIFFKN